MSRVGLLRHHLALHLRRLATRLEATSQRPELEPKREQLRFGPVEPEFVIYLAGDGEGIAQVERVAAALRDRFADH